MITPAGPRVEQHINDFGDMNGIVTPIEMWLFQNHLMDDKDVSALDRYQEYWDEKTRD